MADNLITTSFDAYELYPLLARNTWKGAKEDTTYKKWSVSHDGSESPIPDGVEMHQQFGLGAMVKRGETTTFAFDAPGPVGTKKRYYDQFALAAVLTEKLLIMNKYGIVNKVTTDLGRAYNKRRNMHVAEFWDDFFTGSIYTDIKGTLPMGSASHVSAGAAGVTRSNIINGALGYETAKELLRLMRRFKTERNEPETINLKNIELKCVPENEQEAYRIFSAGSAYEPTSNNNAINVLHADGRKFSVDVNPWLSSTTAFWMCQAGMYPFELWDKQGLITESDRDTETKGIRHDARAMWLGIETEWELAFGSAG